jgi:hypothetical protein
MFISVEDIPIVPEDEIRNAGHESTAVRAGDEQDGGVLHFGKVRSRCPQLLQRFSPLAFVDRASLRGNEDTWPHLCETYFFNAFRIAFAAFAPEPPVNPAPGCVPDPHR